MNLLSLIDTSAPTYKMNYVNIYMYILYVDIINLVCRGGSIDQGEQIHGTFLSNRFYIYKKIYILSSNISAKDLYTCILYIITPLWCLCRKQEQRKEQKNGNYGTGYCVINVPDDSVEALLWCCLCRSAQIPASSETRVYRSPASPCNIIYYYLIRRLLLFYQVLDNLDYFVGISLIDLSTGQ